MPKKPKEYRKLPGIGTGAFRLHLAVRKRLYAGQDHLLLVEGNGYSEDYHRFFFSDMRYVLALRTNGRMVWNLIFGALLALVAAGAAKVAHSAGQFGWDSQDVVAVAILGALGAVFALGMVFNSLRGPTCQCYISTAIQTVRLPVPTRLGQMKRLIDFLGPRIAEAQGPPKAAPTAAPEPL